jgi:hypothetical protein
LPSSDANGRRFEQAIERAVTSCRQSENQPEHHFAGAGKMIEVRNGGGRLANMSILTYTQTNGQAA